MSNRVTHFEIPSANTGKSMKFFGEVFGWSFQKFGAQDYWFVKSGDEKEPGINGAIMKKRDPRQPLVNSISVEDLDVTTEKITQAGGQIVAPKMPIPTVGWLAFFKDPDGNIHGIWESNVEAG